jgi:hypothetical protein
MLIPQKKDKGHWQIALTGGVQVYFVALNTVLIAKDIVIGIFFTSFTISFIWSYNVSKIAFSDTSQRLVYALGAAVGSVLGYYTHKLF